MFEDLRGNNVIEDSAEGKSGKIALDKIGDYTSFSSLEIPKIQITSDHIPREITGYQSCSGSCVESYRMDRPYKSSKFMRPL